MVQVKKATKYGKYFLFLAVASMVTFIWSSKSSQSSFLPTVPHAQADVPGGSDTSSDDGCDDGGDCD
ncbi:MAG: hypothetical protein Q8O97_00685 [bacterium]|nr:hypothetical protein [bacterium]